MDRSHLEEFVQALTNERLLGTDALATGPASAAALQIGGNAMS